MGVGVGGYFCILGQRLLGPEGSKGNQMRFARGSLPRDEVQLFPTNLGDVISQNHPIRLLNELLDQLDWSPFEKKYKVEDRGRPPIHPRILGAVWIYAFFRRVDGSRQLEYQLRTNIEFMWLAEGLKVDHSTLSDFRKTHLTELKELHKSLIKFVKALGVIKIAELFVDGTRIRANASRFETMTAAKAEKLLGIVDQEIERYLQRVSNRDELDDTFDEGISGECLPEHLSDLRQRKEQLEGMRAKCQEMDAIRKKQGVKPEKNPFQLPIADPDSRVLPNKTGGHAPNYTPMITVEGDLGLIVGSTVINSTNEHDQLPSMVDEVEENFDVSVTTVAGDAAYSTGRNIHELEVERGKSLVSPHGKKSQETDNPAVREDPTQPVAEADLDRLPMDPARKVFAPEAFPYDAKEDVCYCPAGCVLRRAYEERRDQGNGQTVLRIIYQAPPDACGRCEMQPRCRPGNNHKEGRRVSRDEFAELRVAHQRKMNEEASKKIYNKRFEYAERPFAIIKQLFGMRRFQTRGDESVNAEFTLAAISHNLLRLMKYFGDIASLRALLSAAAQS